MGRGKRGEGGRETAANGSPADEPSLARLSRLADGLHHERVATNRTNLRTQLKLIEAEAAALLDELAQRP